jgi:hypothetical protein
MAEHTVRKAAGPHRRWIFAVIVLILVAFSAYHVVLFLTVPEQDSIVPAALPGPIIMFTILILGLGWLIWLVTARRRNASRGLGEAGVSSPRAASPPER